MSGFSSGVAGLLVGGLAMMAAPLSQIGKDSQAGARALSSALWLGLAVGGAALFVGAPAVLAVTAAGAGMGGALGWARSRPLKA